MMYLCFFWKQISPLWWCTTKQSLIVVLVPVVVVVQHAYMQYTTTFFDLFFVSMPYTLWHQKYTAAALPKQIRWYNLILSLFVTPFNFLEQRLGYPKAMKFPIYSTWEFSFSLCASFACTIYVCFNLDVPTRCFGKLCYAQMRGL